MKQRVAFDDGLTEKKNKPRAARGSRTDIAGLDILDGGLIKYLGSVADKQNVLNQKQQLARELERGEKEEWKSMIITGDR